MPSFSRTPNLAAAVFGAAFILAGALKQSRAVSGQIHITLVKAGRATQGFGNLFYHGDRYRLDVGGIRADSITSRRLDLIGTVENMQNVSDIIGTYGAADTGGSTIIENAKRVRVRNEKGAILEVNGVNLGKLSLDLAGLTVMSRGWGPDAKEPNNR